MYVSASACQIMIDSALLLVLQKAGKALPVEGCEDPQRSFEISRDLLVKYTKTFDLLNPKATKEAYLLAKEQYRYKPASIHVTRTHIIEIDFSDSDLKRILKAFEKRTPPRYGQQSGHLLLKPRTDWRQLGDRPRQ